MSGDMAAVLAEAPKRLNEVAEAALGFLRVEEGKDGDLDAFVVAALPGEGIEYIALAISAPDHRTFINYVRVAANRRMADSGVPYPAVAFVSETWGLRELTPELDELRKQANAARRDWIKDPKLKPHLVESAMVHCESVVGERRTFALELTRDDQGHKHFGPPTLVLDASLRLYYFAVHPKEATGG